MPLARALRKTPPNPTSDGQRNCNNDQPTDHEHGRLKRRWHHAAVRARQYQNGEEHHGSGEAKGHNRGEDCEGDSHVERSLLSDEVSAAHAGV